MAIMARWSSKTWEVSSQRIAALNGLSAGVKLNTQNSDDKAGSPATQTRALELQTMTLDFDLAIAAGCDVRNEYESWTALVGQYAPFILGGRQFGPANMQLTAVSLNDATADAFGRIPEGKISITLTEYAEEASSKKATAGSSGGTKKTTPGLASARAELGLTASAAGIGASSSAKAAKKPSNTQMQTQTR